MKPMGKDLRGLIGAVEVRVVFRDGVRGSAGVSVHVHPQSGSCEITAEEKISIQF